MTAPLAPLADSVRGLSGPRRFLLLGGLAVTIGLVWALTSWAATPTYAPLFRDLELSAASTVQERLSKTDIPFRLEDGGSTISVPVADLARARVTLAKDGMPGTGRQGFELFDKANWVMTEFTQKVTYQRALEGELARTISAIHGIRRAEVHLVLPTSSAIRRMERPASASVLLSLAPGQRLPADAVQGIAYLMGGSVEELSPENVAIMDDQGRLLSIPGDAGAGAGLTTRQLDIQHGVEQSLAANIDGLLTPVLGPGKVRAQVSAQLSFDQTDRTIESFDPDGQVLQNEQRSEDGTAGGDSGGNTVVFNNTYQNSRKLEKIIGAVGTLTRLSVAVLVDAPALEAVGGPLRTPGSLEAMIRNAIGADSARGDRVSVVAVPFEPAAAAVAMDSSVTSVPTADPMAIIERFIRPVVGLVGLVILVLAGLRVLSTLSVPAPAPALAQAESAAALARAEAGTDTAGGRFSPTRDRPELVAMAQADPGVRVLKGWLADS